MTEYSQYRPDQALQDALQQERLVFVDPTDRHAREFHIAPPASQDIGADSPEVNQAVEDAYRAVHEERSEAAARTPEQAATDAELSRAIGWNAQTIQVTRDHAGEYGLAA